jgi:hypothetical protein
LFPAPDYPLENIATRNIFWVNCDTYLVFFGYRNLWREVPILFQNLRSELVYTFKWTKSVARLWRNQIWECTLKEKKNPPTYWTIGEMEGRVRETNIFLRVASPLKLWVRIPLRWGVLDTTLRDKVCQSLAAGRWFSPGTLVSFTNKTDLHDITELLLKVALNTITLTLTCRSASTLVYLQQMWTVVFLFTISEPFMFLFTISEPFMFLFTYFTSPIDSWFLSALIIPCGARWI